MQRIAGNQFQIGTIVTPQWLQAIQEEVAGVIEGMGLVLDPNNPNQLLEALMKLSQVQVGQTIESLGNPGDNFRPMGSTLLRASFPALDAVMPTPNHDAISGGISYITAAPYSRVVYGNGVYVAVATSNATPIARSVDGVNWTYPALGAISVPKLYDVQWNGNLFVAVGTYSNSAPHSLILTSPDGVNWTQRATNTYLPTLKSVTWNGTVWCAGAASDPNVYTSPDGFTWTMFDPSITVNTIVGSAKVMPAEMHYAAGRYLSLGTSKLTDGSGNKLLLDVLLVSPDTVNWYGIQLKSLPDQLLFAGNGNFVVGLSVNQGLYTTLTFDPTKVVLNIPESNKYVRVK